MVLLTLSSYEMKIKKKFVCALKTLYEVCTKNSKNSCTEVYSANVVML